MGGNRSQQCWISLTRELLVRDPVDVCSRPAASCNASRVVSAHQVLVIPVPSVIFYILYFYVTFLAMGLCQFLFATQNS